MSRRLSDLLGWSHKREVNEDVVNADPPDMLADPPAEPAEPLEPQAEVCRSPVALDGSARSKTGLIFVEVVESFDGYLAVAGWVTNDAVDLGLAIGGEEVDCRSFFHTRDDVKARHGGGTGFTLVAQVDDPIAVELICLGEGMDRPRRLPLSRWPSTDVTRPLLGEALSAVLRDADPTLALDEIRRALPEVGSAVAAPKAFLEGLMRAPVGERGFVYGWALHDRDARLWFEHGDQIIELDQAYRQRRQDVLTSFPSSPDSYPLHGLMLRIDRLDPSSTVRLVAAVEGGKMVLAEVGVTRVLSANPVEAARTLFSIETPIGQLSRRLRHVDLPLLSDLSTAWSMSLSASPVWSQSFGQELVDPDVSIIVPVYGTGRFFQNQIVALSEDPDIHDRCEIIYVIDDPRLEDSFLADAAEMEKLWGVRCTVVGNGTNQGFSAANNLGVGAARGARLLFMNSDVIPRSNGWLRRLEEVLTAEDAGIVGPMLLHADGGVQHAGMAFDRNAELDIWINEHPGKGLQPDLLPEGGVRPVDAVTGACMLMDRALFDSVGGWETGYIVGDFEDSDLCLKAREAGREILFVPDAVLTHLERQSFRFLGREDLNLRLTIANSALLESRWDARIQDAGRVTT